MADFNNETWVAQPIKQINTYFVVELHYNVLESLELYKKQYYNNIQPVSLPALKGRIYVLYQRIKWALNEEERFELDKLLKPEEIE